MQNRIVSLALCFGLAGSVPAWAEPDARGRSDPGSRDASEDRRRAKEAFDEGIELLDARDLDRAAKAFQRSLAIRQSLPVLYNLAVCYQGLGRFKQAKLTLESFLALAVTSSAPEEAVARARSLVAAVGANLGQLDLEVKGGAERVFLDDQPIAQGDGPVTMELDPGEHRVRVERRGVRAVERPIKVSAGERARLVLETSKEALPGRLSIAIQPSDAEVRLDGQVIGRGSVARPVSAGAHELEVVAPDHVPIRRSIRVEPERTESLTLSLEREPPSITETWWFWTGLGVVAVGAGAGIAVALTRSDPGGGSLNQTLVVPRGR